MNFKLQLQRLMGNVIPMDAAVYETVQAIEISYVTSHFAPYTGGGTCTIPKGEQLIVRNAKAQINTAYYCEPLNYEGLEKTIVDQEERDEPTYAGYMLSVPYNVLLSNCKLIERRPIHYVKGDATNPQTSNTAIIIHVCNDVGGWGKGFVLAISRKWNQPEEAYRLWYKQQSKVITAAIQYQRIESRDKYADESKFELGKVQFVKVNETTWVANMIAQVNTKPDADGTPPIRYIFVKECLERVTAFALAHQATVHLPRIGCGLAGGQWSETEPLIKHTLIANAVDTTVYDFE